MKNATDLPARFAALPAARAAAIRARGQRLRLVDGEATATHLVLIEFRDRTLRAIDIAHLDEREAGVLHESASAMQGERSGQAAEDC